MRRRRPLPTPSGLWRHDPDSFDTLRSLDVPSLVVVGAEDVLTPPTEADAMVEAPCRTRHWCGSTKVGHLTSGRGAAGSHGCPRAADAAAVDGAGFDRNARCLLLAEPVDRVEVLGAQLGVA